MIEEKPDIEQQEKEHEQPQGEIKHDADEPGAEQTTPEATQAEETQAEEIQTEQTPVEENPGEQPQAEETAVEEPSAEETSSEEPVAEETIAEESDDDSSDEKTVAEEQTAQTPVEEPAEKPTAAEKPAVKSAPTASSGIEGMKWYAIRTITGHEKRVKNYLDNERIEAGIENKIAQVLIPEEKVFEVKGGKKKIKYKNFFPGYVLVEALLDKEIVNFLSHAPSVLKMVGDKNEAIALRDDEVKRIIGRITDSDEKEKIDMQFDKGDLVKVVSGPFVNFNGTINEINLERMKVKVMVSIFGRKTPIELDFAQIEREK